MALVGRVIRRMGISGRPWGPPHPDMADLHQAGLVTLWRCSQNYDRTLSIRFAHYACRSIARKISSEMAKTKIYRFKLNQFVEQTRGVVATQKAREQIVSRVRETMSLLRKENFKLLKGLYLNGHNRGKWARSMGISRPTLRLIERGAKDRFKKIWLDTDCWPR